jgi:serine protease Do
MQRSKASNMISERAAGFTPAVRHGGGKPRRSLRLFGVAAGVVALAVTLLHAQQPVKSVAAEVNKKMVKVFGGGGYKSLPSYGTGVLVSPNGYLLTVNNHILAWPALRIHLYDGRQYDAKVVAKEPELDIALVKIDGDIDGLSYFDFPGAAGKRLAEPGDWVLAFSNQFHIATRDEPMSVQHGVVTAYAELRGRRGVFDAPFQGEVYFLDCIACNPGAAGGVITTRKGDLLGILGRELKNSLSDTWINYAVPVQARAEILRDNKAATVDLATFVREGMAGKYRQSEKKARDKDGGGGYHGIVLVPNVVSLTPPYVEEVLAGSPAAKAGIRPDDLIVYVDGELVPSIRMFRDVLKSTRPGNSIRLELQRGSKLISVDLKLTDFPKKKTP